MEHTTNNTNMLFLLADLMLWYIEEIPEKTELKYKAKQMFSRSAETIRKESKNLTDLLDRASMVIKKHGTKADTENFVHSSVELANLIELVIECEKRGLKDALFTQIEMFKKLHKI